MAHWPNDGGRFNVMHLADLSPPNFGRQPSQSQVFSYTGTGAGPMPMLAANYRALIFGGSSKKNKGSQSDSKGYSRRSKQSRKRGNIVSRGGTNIC